MRALALRDVEEDTMIAQHLSKSNEHYTPAHIVERARTLLGVFNLDPASCHEANVTVRAERIFTIADDGLSQPWHGRVFLNPPGGTIKLVDGKWRPAKGGGARSSMQVWWEQLCAEWQSGNVHSAFFVAFTLEILRLAQSSPVPVQHFPRCYPRERLAFGGDQPTHANVLVYLPPKGTRRSDALHVLETCFSDVGLCEGGRWSL
jgi:hypothetical protein